MKNGRLWIWMPVLLLISAAAGLYFGSAELSAADFFAALTFRGTVTHELILYGLRLPRACRRLQIGAERNFV